MQTCLLIPGRVYTTVLIFHVTKGDMQGYLRNEKTTSTKFYELNQGVCKNKY